MFVTILTVLYSAIALFIVINFLRAKASKIAKWSDRVLFKNQGALYGDLGLGKIRSEDEETNGLSLPIKKTKEYSDC